MKAKLPETVFSDLFIYSLISFFLCTSGILFSSFQSLTNFLQSSCCYYRVGGQNGDIDHSLLLSFKQGLPPLISGCWIWKCRNCVLAVWLGLISVPYKVCRVNENFNKKVLYCLALLMNNFWQLQLNIYKLLEVHLEPFMICVAPNTQNNITNTFNSLNFCYFLVICVYG